MTNDEKEDWAKELKRIASDLTDDKYSQATEQIKKALEGCKNRLDGVIKNL